MVKRNDTVKFSMVLPGVSEYRATARVLSTHGETITVLVNGEHSVAVDAQTGVSIDVRTGVIAKVEAQDV